MSDLEDRMKPVIRALTLKGFRSFLSERIEFGNLTFLVGQNGAGKTNLVDAFAFLQEVSTQPLSQVIGSRGGLDAMAYQAEPSAGGKSFGLKVEIEGPGISTARYSFEVRSHGEHDFEVANEQCHVHSKEGELWFHRDRRNFASNVGGLQPMLDSQFLALPVIGGTRQFLLVYKVLSSISVYRMGVEPLRQARKAGAHDRLLPDWSNAANVLQYLAERSPESIERIGEILSALAPATLRVQPRIQNGRVSIEFEQERSEGGPLKFDPASMSDGTLRVLGLLLAVFQRSTRTLLVFEEPEANVHPRALSIVSDLLEGISRKAQVLVTTHSPELLDAKWISDDHLRVVYWEGDASRISRVGKASREALQEHLMGAGELLRSSLLDRPPVQRERSEHTLFGPLP